MWQGWLERPCHVTVCLGMLSTLHHEWNLTADVRMFLLFILCCLKWFCKKISADCIHITSDSNKLLAESQQGFITRPRGELIIKVNSSGQSGVLILAKKTPQIGEAIKTSLYLVSFSGERCSEYLLADW